MAHELSKRSSASPAELREAGLPAKTQQILANNFYGWFERVERGVYRLNDAGREALNGYRNVIEKISG